MYVNVRIPDGQARVDQGLAVFWRAEAAKVFTARAKDKAESYFARQMGMTVPQWRQAQAAVEAKKWTDRYAL